MGRVRRRWDEDEDAALKAAVSKAQEEGKPLIWHDIAASLPGRTNKDCRKRWYGKTAAKVNKGSWTAEEDEKLYNAVRDVGTKWSIVAGEIGTRTGDQCSKRWNHTVNPEIDHSPWTAREDELLLQGVQGYGHNWQQIVSLYFPRRTSLGAKNRYHLLCRKANGARGYTRSLAPDSRPGLARADSVDLTMDSDSSDTSSGDDEYEDPKSLQTMMTRPDDESRPAKKRKSDMSQYWKQHVNGSSAEAFDDINAVAKEMLSTQTAPDLFARANEPSINVPGLSDFDPALYAFDADTSSTPNRRSCCDGSGRSSPARLRSPISGTSNHIGSNLSGASTSVWPMQPVCFDTNTLPGNDRSFAGDVSQRDKNSSSSSSRNPAAAQRCPLASANNDVHQASLRNSTTGLRNTVRGIHTSSPETPKTPSTRRVSIQVVCAADKLGPVVQAVTDLSLSVVFKTDPDE